MTATKPEPFEFNRETEQAILRELSHLGTSRQAAQFITNAGEEICWYLAFERENKATRSGAKTHDALNNVRKYSGELLAVLEDANEWAEFIEE